MTVYRTNNTDLGAVADAIRTKGGTSASLTFPSGFISAIEAISTGGETYPADDGKAHLFVSFPEGSDLTFPEGISFYNSVSGALRVDWGDGSNPQTYSGYYSNIGSHTYASAGNYEIQVYVASGALGRNVGQLVKSNSGNFSNASTRQAIGQWSCLKKVILPGISSGAHGVYSFRACPCLEEIIVHLSGSETVDIMGDDDIDGMISTYSLKRIVLLDTNGNVVTPTTTIVPKLHTGDFNNCWCLEEVFGSGNFSYCYAIKNAVVPSSTIYLSYVSFRECRNLKELTFESPSQATSIPANFCYYTAISSIDIPNSITSIGNSAFQYCMSLNSINLSSALTTIGTSAFSSCYSLRSITFPATLTSIGNEAFRYIYALNTVRFLGSTPPTFGTNWCPDSTPTTVYVPSGSENDYAAVLPSGWSSHIVGE